MAKTCALCYYEETDRFHADHGEDFPVVPEKEPEDPKDIIIRTLKAEVAELAEALGDTAADLEGQGFVKMARGRYLRAEAARVLLARLEART